MASPVSVHNVFDLRPSAAESATLPSSAIQLAGSLDPQTSSEIVKAQTLAFGNAAKIDRAKALISASYRRVMNKTAEERAGFMEDAASVRDDISMVASHIAEELRSLSPSASSHIRKDTAAEAVLASPLFKRDEAQDQALLNDNESAVLFSCTYEVNHNIFTRDTVLSHDRGTCIRMQGEVLVTAFVALSDLVAKKRTLVAELNELDNQISEANDTIRSLEKARDERLSTVALEIEGNVVTDEMAAQVVGDITSTRRSRTRRPRKIV